MLAILPTKWSSHSPETINILVWMKKRLTRLDEKCTSLTAVNWWTDMPAFQTKKERSIVSEAQRAEVGVGFLLCFKCSGRFLLLHSWYWASRDTELHRPISVRVSDYSSQTTEPICIKITLVDRTYHGDCYRLVSLNYLQPPHWNSSERMNVNYF